MKSRYLLLNLVFLSSAVCATMPVIDAAAIAKIVTMTDKLLEQTQILEKELIELGVHSELLDAQLTLLSGINEFGKIANSAADKQSRQWAPDSIEAFEDMVRHGFNPGDLKDRYEYYDQKFPAIDSELIDSKNPTSDQRDMYEYRDQWTKMQLSTFAQTFDQINDSFKTVNDLMEKIQEHDSLKESADFNNRVLGELAYLLRSLIQLQNMQLHATSLTQQTEQSDVNSHVQFFNFRRPYENF